MAQETANSPDPLTESILAIIQRWRQESPQAHSVPRGVRKEISLAIREDQRRQFLDYQRARLDIEAAVREHQHTMLVGYRPRSVDTPETWFARQQQLERDRLAIEQRINAEPRLSAEDRGQAVTSLSVAHHAPSVPMLPVFTPLPARGLPALRARLHASLSRLRVGLAGDRERRRLEQWEQLHRERAEQAPQRPDREAAHAVNTAHALGLGDNPVWMSRDTHEQREARVTQLETQAADHYARLSALENIAAALREENDRLNRQVAQAPSVSTESSAQSDATQEQRRAVAQTVSDPAAVVNSSAGAGKAGVGSSDEANSSAPESISTADASQGGNSANGRSAPEAPHASAAETTTANLINTAHPNIGAAQPQQPATPTPATTGQHATAAPSADQELGV
ncbi:hypothetical protein [Nocardia terpenica]|uniref:Uncharacterized protein n=1 Tax=Nocardia terpenica TaxID=455432 RepID=A0A164KQH6_9NOCA|nr:hypothetical protein [Nocardia terpenica]KZM71632.1 hypothetical protein AWN90_02595 [Nocardia terpenica]NQE90850.1 hypothetical protein [Nocardia terpenica]